MNTHCYPFSPPSFDSARYQQAKLDMRGNGGAGIRTRLGLSSSGIRLPNRLRHCSVCDAENRDHFGETFWSRLHQITGINARLGRDEQFQQGPDVFKVRAPA